MAHESASDQTRKILGDKPIGNIAGFVKNLRYDLLSGFLVFLIALPLCLAISQASGFPPIAGLFTAIIGAVVATLVSNSELTIKGPAAGMIVIVAGCVSAFGGDGMTDGFVDADMSAYRMALAVGVVAAVLQIVFGLLRGGILGEFFPLAAVHGMLAAIGVIIIVKQIPNALGAQGKGEPLEMIKEIPHYFAHMNPEIALIGGIGLVIMFTWPLLQNAYKFLRAIPSASIVLLVTIPLGMYFDLLHTHGYQFAGMTYEVGETFLVKMPTKMFGMFESLAYPDFNAFSSERLSTAIYWVGMFFAIGSLESLLSAKAVDILDPWKRKTNMNRDTVAVGIGNLISSSVGGLPMISEIVRSKANIDNGGRTRFANFWHGMFLLVCVALIPTVLHRIPMAALASMLIYTGFRLTHPREFVSTYRIGREQLVIFVATLVGVLATDLLVGILIGIGVKMLIHVFNGVPIISLFKPFLDVSTLDDKTVLVQAQKSAVFSNWILFRSKLVKVGINERQNVVLDMSKTNLVDHSVMEKLHELESDFTDANLELKIIGLDLHGSNSKHQFSARKLDKLRRVTVIIPPHVAELYCARIIALGATGYTLTDCVGVGRHQIQAAHSGQPSSAPMVKIETIVPLVLGERILEYLQSEISSKYPNSVVIERVDVLKTEGFVGQPAITTR